MQFNKYTHTHTHTHTHTQVPLIPPWEDQCEWHRMTRMTGPDCAVMCNLINTHTHTHTHTRMLWDERAGRLTGQSLGPLVANRVDLGSFSSRCCTFRRTHTSPDPTRLLTVYPTSFTLHSPLALTICAQRKTYDWCSTPGPMAGGDFLA